MPPHRIDSDSNSEDEIKVLITGFGPFREEYPRNPSSLIANSLPRSIIFPPSLKSGTHTKICLIPYPTQIHVSFSTVRRLIPALYTSLSHPEYDPLYAECDYILHIGMAGTADEYRVERLGHRDGYYARVDKKTGEMKVTKDVDGKTLKDCEEEMKLEEGEYWDGCPEIIQTTLDVDEIVERMHAAGVGGEDDKIKVRASDDAGHYLCDFIYYSSLAHFWRKGKGEGERKVVFLHVPPESDEEVLDKGREVTLALVRAMVESGLEA